MVSHETRRNGALRMASANPIGHFQLTVTLISSAHVTLSRSTPIPLKAIWSFLEGSPATRKHLTTIKNNYTSG